MIALIRIRGNINLHPEIKYAFNILGLFRVNHMALLKENETVKGTMQKLNNHATFGQINKEVLTQVLEKRAELVGGKKISQDDLKKWKLNNFNEMAEQMIKENKTLREFPGLKTIIRLHPPIKGFERKGKKIDFSKGGMIGNRKEKINALILRMI